MTKSRKRKAAPSPCKYRFLAALIFFLISAALLLISTLIPGTAEWYSSRVYHPAAAAISSSASISDLNLFSCTVAQKTIIITMVVAEKAAPMA